MDSLEVNKEIGSMLLTAWTVLYGVSFGWSFYSLMDQWPRLVRFGSVLRFNNPLSFMMIFDWLLIFFLVTISFSGLVRGAIYFKMDLNEPSFPILVSLISLTLFIIPFFINRAVWGFTLFFFPLEFKKFVSKCENRKYLDRRFTVETVQKLYMCPEYGGIWAFCESISIVLLLSLAVSGLCPGAYTLYVFLFLLGFVLLAHFPWPQRIKVKPENLPPTLNGNLHQHSFEDSDGKIWFHYSFDFKPCISKICFTSKIQYRKLGFCSEDFEEFFEIYVPDTDPLISSNQYLREQLEKAKDACRTKSFSIQNKSRK